MITQHENRSLRTERGSVESLPSLISHNPNFQIQVLAFAEHPGVVLLSDIKLLSSNSPVDDRTSDVLKGADKYCEKRVEDCNRPTALST